MCGAGGDGGGGGDEKGGGRSGKKPVIYSLDSSDEEDQHVDKDEDDDDEGDDDTTAISKQAKQLVDNLIDEKMQSANADLEVKGASQSSAKERISKVKINMTKAEKEVKMYQALLDKVRNPTPSSSSSSSSAPATSEGAMTEADIARIRSKATSHASLQNLPQVRTQLERFAAASTISTSLGINSLSGSGDAASVPSGGEVMHFVTRLNGKHTWKWQIGSSESFEKVPGLFQGGVTASFLMSSFVELYVLWSPVYLL